MSTERALNRLAKWRVVFAGWQLGKRAKGDPESDAVRDHREVTILLRCEVSALAAALIEAGVIKHDDFMRHLKTEADFLCMAYEAKFPGITAVDEGIKMDPSRVTEWMKNWRP